MFRLFKKLDNEKHKTFEQLYQMYKKTFGNEPIAVGLTRMHREISEWNMEYAMELAESGKSHVKCNCLNRLIPHRVCLVQVGNIGRYYMKSSMYEKLYRSRVALMESSDQEEDYQTEDVFIPTKTRYVNPIGDPKHPDYDIVAWVGSLIKNKD